MMLRQTGKLVAIGLVLGLAGGRVLAMGATSLLYRVSPSPAPGCAYRSVALLASYVPCSRHSGQRCGRVDLRHARPAAVTRALQRATRYRRGAAARESSDPTAEPLG